VSGNGGAGHQANVKPTANVSRQPTSSRYWRRNSQSLHQAWLALCRGATPSSMKRRHLFNQPSVSQYQAYVMTNVSVAARDNLPNDNVLIMA